MCAVAGSWASRRPSLPPYGTGTGAAGATKGRPLLEAANVYDPPPGVNGRMRRTGLAVHAVTSCARAAPAMSSTANAAPHLRTSLRFKRVRVSSP
jgi:hypothetical protein